MIIPKELIKKAKSKLGNKAAFLIAESLNLDQFDEKNLKACCPIHYEKTPSFVYNEKHNHYHCFGCGCNYGILDLYMSEGLTYLEAVEKLFKETGIDYKFGEKGIKIKREYVYPERENSPRNKAEEYLAKRKISKETLDYCDIQADANGNIALHYYDTNDVLMTVKYRPSKKTKKGEAKAWCQKDKDTTPLLFNMNRVDPTQPLVITEGEIDTLSVIEAGYRNVVSVPFGCSDHSWIENNWDWLEQFDKIILWTDNDEPGIKMRRMVIPRLGEWRCLIVEISESVEINGKQQNIKDANEVLFFLGKDKVIEYIANANEIPVSNVVDLYDIEDFDVKNAGGIYSGFKQLDKWIYKFFFGCLSIITGINGGGKTVLINQMCLCEPVNQGYDVFLFSGEMTKPQIKNWLDLNFAGRRHIKVEDTHVRRIDSTKKELIREWYKGRIFIYDNDIDYRGSTILAKMEELARKNGTKVFVIDNLMTIDLECSSENIWQKQKEFVVKLVNFAQKFDVLVHLVAHPRKLEGIRKLTKMDVGGSGDITNLAHYVIAMHRVTPKEKEGVMNGKGNYISEPIKYDCIIDLFKNRITGTQDKEMGIYFDSPSYRLWSTPEELDKKYNWDKEIYKDTLPNPIDVETPEFMKGN